MFSPSLPEPGCQLFPALGSATPGHSCCWATWNPASRPVSSEPPCLPCFASYARPRSGSMRQCCPHLVLDVTQGPGPRVFTAGHPQIIQDSWGPSISIPPEVSSTPFNHVSLISARMPAAQRSQGAGLGTHSALPRAGSSHGLCHATGSAAATVRHHVSNTLRGFFWYLSCRGRHTCHL